jgi:pectin methylesterase-like acyl-CoA thioesterase
LPPENVVLHGATETTLTFQWDAVVGATAYGWVLVDMGYNTLKSGTVTQRNVQVTGLKPGTTYLFSVRCEAKDEVFEYSSPIEAATAGQAPDPSAQVVCVDSPIIMELDHVPVMGTSGYVRIFKANGTEVDCINLADISTVTVREDGVMIPKEQIASPSLSTTFMNTLSCGGSKRIVHYTPFWIKGKSFIIKPHSGVLDFDTEYYVTVDESVCGQAVAAGEWTFVTQSAPSTTSIRVNPDGSADFCTLQRALSHAADGATITLADATYPELLYLRDKKNITVKGESRTGTVIAYPNSEVYMVGSSNRCLWLVENCDNLVLENLTVENTFGNPKGQAECIYFNSGNNTHKLTIENCSLISWQDTFLCKGSVWVHNSLIAGHCDYIWGYPQACLFEDCEIRSRAAGYIVQARINNATDKGFVFLNCSLTAESGVADGSMYMARSGGDTSKYDNVTYINCAMSSVIAPAGWYTSPAPTPSAPTAVSGWKEYGTTGVSTAQRNAYGKILTAEEAAAYSSRQAVLGW